jgi:serine/threonine-protein kinase
MPDAVDKLFLDFQAALAGRYSLERELGRGGMGVVYLAREVRLDRLVAIKVLPPELAAHTPMRERFLREARTAAGLSHPHIVPIFAVDEIGSFVFYAMSYISGETLAQRIATRGPMPAREGCRLLRDVAWALAYAHEKGIVHRDVKPENIMIEAGTARAVVMDFGIARLGRISGGTGVGEVLGTPAFMSPEQASAEEIDGRSDLYSLGVVGYYALAGKLPFEAREAHALLAQHLTQPAPTLATVARQVPRQLAQTVQRCLAKSRDERFADGRELAEALDGALEPARELPAPLRAFVRLELQAGWGLVTWPVVVAFFAVVSLVVATGGGWAEALAWNLNWGTIIVVIATIFYTYAARRLLRGGYAYEDWLAALRTQYALRIEELALETSLHGRVGRAFRALLSLAAYGGLLATAVGLASSNQALYFTATVVAVMGALAASVVTESGRPAVWLDRSWRLWRGWVGRTLFWLAGLGLRRRASQGSAAHRPTEVALGLALADLFRALPAAQRGALADLPDVTRRLEQHAQTLRERLEQLDRLVVEAGQAPRVAGATGPRDSALDAMRVARDAVGQRRAAVVGALESLRLGLLRLHAGAVSVEGVTADLAAARELGSETGRLAAAQREAEAARA